ncbi:DUF1963 domain-containing protein [Clostridium tarantellae]|uniref:DUF1963 domain-containing protein n=1 Tax=Clostridium tarantellae TaxID=39493 RepID=A0A6I1MXS7_9CLOT|nr:DUF1963 domain-containing protein [Clostridium tarantellae]
MDPLATIFIEKNDYLPKDLNGIALITIFISDSFYDGNIDFNNFKKYFNIKTYTTTKNLIYCQWDNKYMKHFPLTEEYVNNDYPLWDDGGIPNNLFEILCEMEDSNDIDYYEDIAEDFYSQHKIGGYPSFRQSGYWFNEEYNYVLQISSDEKANFNIVHNGNFYFYYNSKKNDWKVYCDFY